VSPNRSESVRKIDEERVKVAEALGIRAITAKEWLFLAYGANGKNLRDAMKSNPGYRGDYGAK